MLSLQPYTDYKKSGVPWMEDIPKHWDTSRGKWLFKKVNRSVSDSDEVITCFRDGTVTLRKNRRLSGFTEALKEIGYQGIRVGDLVIHAMDAFAGAVGVSDSNGKGSPVYSVCTPYNSVEPKYYAHLIREMARNKWILALSKGIRERSTDFRFETFGSQVLPLPPVNEQRAIVRYLDYVDKRVKKYIRAKQKQIKLLEEMKQAIIHQAVTRGLDANVSMSQTNLPWLPEMPSHWRIFRGKSIFGTVDVRSTTGLEELLSVSTDFGVVPRSSVNVYMFKAESYIGHKLCWPDDLVINSIWAWAGGLGISNYHGIISTAYGVYRVKNKTEFLPKYLHYFVRSSAFHWELLVRSKGIWKSRLQLTDTSFLDAPFVIPTYEEQLKIVEYLEQKLLNLETRIILLQKPIKIIKEYQTRLIADIVTGKLDVRESANQLPDEIEESLEEPDETFEEDLENGEEMEEAIPEEE